MSHTLLHSAIPRQHLATQSSQCLHSFLPNSLTHIFELNRFLVGNLFLLLFIHILFPSIPIMISNAVTKPISHHLPFSLASLLSFYVQSCFNILLDSSHKSLSLVQRQCYWVPFTNLTSFNRFCSERVFSLIF